MALNLGFRAKSLVFERLSLHIIIIMLWYEIRNINDMRDAQKLKLVLLNPQTTCMYNINIHRFQLKLVEVFGCDCCG